MNFINKYIEQSIALHKDDEVAGTLYDELLDIFEYAVFSKVLIATRNNQSKAARMLGMSRAGLRSKINRIKNNKSKSIDKDILHEQFEQASKELFDKFEKDHAMLELRFGNLNDLIAVKT